MGLEVSRIFARADGSFHIRNTMKATLGTSSRMSQKRTLRQRHHCKLFLSAEILLIYKYFACSQGFPIWTVGGAFPFCTSGTCTHGIKAKQSDRVCHCLPGVSNVLVQDLKALVRLGDVGLGVRLPRWGCGRVVRR